MKKVVHKTTLDNQGRHDRGYWLSKTPAERIVAVEALRMEYFGKIGPIEKALKIVQLNELT